MTLNTKENCAESIASRLIRTRRWRQDLATRYPQDTRNLGAVETLARLASDANNLTDEHWAALKPHYNWSSERWNESVSIAARHVEFRPCMKTFDAFIHDLISILSETSVAA
jgi:hypothetical protein